MVGALNYQQVEVLESKILELFAIMLDVAEALVMADRNNYTLNFVPEAPKVLNWRAPLPV